MFREVKIESTVYFMRTEISSENVQCLFCDFASCAYWSEKTTKETLMTRFKSLNPRITYNEWTVSDSISNLDPTEQTWEDDDENTTKALKLKYRVENVPFKIVWKLKRLEPQEIKEFVLQPLFTTILGLNQQVDELKEIIKKKDAEIKQYKIEGSVLKRTTVQTQIFDFELYEKKHIKTAKNSKIFSKIASFFKEPEMILSSQEESNKPTDKGMKNEVSKSPKSNKPLESVSPRQRKRKALEAHHLHVINKLRAREQLFDYRSSQSQSQSQSQSEDTDTDTDTDTDMEYLPKSPKSYGKKSRNLSAIKEKLSPSRKSKKTSLIRKENISTENKILKNVPSTPRSRKSIAIIEEIELSSPKKISDGNKKSLRNNSQEPSTSANSGQKESKDSSNRAKVNEKNEDIDKDRQSKRLKMDEKPSPSGNCKDSISLPKENSSPSGNCKENISTESETLNAIKSTPRSRKSIAIIEEIELSSTKKISDGNKKSLKNNSQDPLTSANENRKEDSGQKESKDSSNRAKVNEKNEDTDTERQSKRLKMDENPSPPGNCKETISLPKENSSPSGNCKENTSTESETLKAIKSSPSSRNSMAIIEYVELISSKKLSDGNKKSLRNNNSQDPSASVNQKEDSGQKKSKDPCNKAKVNEKNEDIDKDRQSKRLKMDEKSSPSGNCKETSSIRKEKTSTESQTLKAARSTPRRRNSIVVIEEIELSTPKKISDGNKKSLKTTSKDSSTSVNENGKADSGQKESQNSSKRAKVNEKNEDTDTERQSKRLKMDEKNSPTLRGATDKPSPSGNCKESSFIRKENTSKESETLKAARSTPRRRNSIVVIEESESLQTQLSDGNKKSLKNTSKDSSTSVNSKRKDDSVQKESNSLSVGSKIKRTNEDVDTERQSRILQTDGNKSPILSANKDRPSKAFSISPQRKDFKDSSSEAKVNEKNDTNSRKSSKNLSCVDEAVAEPQSPIVRTRLAKIKEKKTCFKVLRNKKITETVECKTIYRPGNNKKKSKGTPSKRIPPKKQTSSKSKTKSPEGSNESNSSPACLGRMQFSPSPSGLLQEKAASPEACTNPPVAESETLTAFGDINEKLDSILKELKRLEEQRLADLKKRNVLAK